jgi:glycosyltransferase involved in cell wall biosynthesis
MKPDVAITLVIPSYNRAQLIIETITCALNQTSSFAEIIVVDDASTDKTLFELEQFGSRITVIASEKIGVQTARNRGVDAASTPYVALCDSDDLLEPNFVEIISGWLVAHQECDSVYSNFVTFDEASTSPDKFSGAPVSFFKGSTRKDNFCSEIPDLYAKTVEYQPLFSSGVTIKRSFYQSIGGYNPKLNGIGSEDWEYTLRAIETGKVSVCMTPLVRIRRHPGNDSGNKIRQLLGEVTVLKHALEFHKISAEYPLEIARGMDIRTIQAFELAFSSKHYDFANNILKNISKYPPSIKFTIKVIIVKLSSFFHTILRLSPLPSSSNATKYP